MRRSSNHSLSLTYSLALTYSRVLICCCVLLLYVVGRFWVCEDPQEHHQASGHCHTQRRQVGVALSTLLQWALIVYPLVSTIPLCYLFIIEWHCIARSTRVPTLSVPTPFPYSNVTVYLPVCLSLTLTEPMTSWYGMTRHHHDVITLPHQFSGSVRIAHDGPSRQAPSSPPLPPPSSPPPINTTIPSATLQSTLPLLKTPYITLPLSLFLSYVPLST